MKKIVCILLAAICSSAAIAQEAQREEFYYLGAIKMLAYSFHEEQEYNFILFGQSSSSISGTDNGSFFNTIQFFTGNASETFHFLDEIKNFIAKNPSNDLAALKMGDLMIHRLARRSSGYCLFMAERRSVVVRDREFNEIYEAFGDYCKRHEIEVD